MRHIEPMKAGISVGVVVGLWHLVWAALVGVGWAKPLMDFVLRLHFIEFQFQLAPFALRTASVLVALTFAVGFLFGAAFALVWNWLAHSPSAESRPAQRHAHT